MNQVRLVLKLLTQINNSFIQNTIDNFNIAYIACYAICKQCYKSTQYEIYYNFYIKTKDTIK